MTASPPTVPPSTAPPPPSSASGAATSSASAGAAAAATDPGPVGPALARLDAALNRLEAVVVRRREAEASPDDREVERALMDEDRARLAAALDAASARLAEVEATAGAVGHRLDRAIEAVSGVLGRPGRA